MTATPRKANFRKQLLAILVARAVEPFSITQLFPYINSLCEHLLPGTSKSDIGKYSGPIESLFAVGSFLAMYQWGRLSDGIGRKPSLIIGMLGIAVTSFAFGLSKNYWVAVAARLLGGMLCGNSSVIRAALGEITPSDAEAWVYP